MPAIDLSYEANPIAGMARSYSRRQKVMRLASSPRSVSALALRLRQRNPLLSSSRNPREPI